MSSDRIATLALELQNQRFNAGLRKSQSLMYGLGQESNALTATLKRTAGAMAGLVVGSKAIRMLYSSVHAASAYREDLAQFDHVMRNVTKTANNMVKTLTSADFGRTNMQARQMLMGMTSLAKGMGMTDKAAVELSGQFSKMAIDIGSFMMRDPEAIMGAFQSALMGNTMALRTYGVFLNEATLKERIAENARKGMVFASERQARAHAILTEAQRQQTDAMGDFAVEARNFGNQWRLFQAGMSELPAKFGKGLLSPMNEGLKTVNSFIDRLRAMDDETWKTIGRTAAFGTAIATLTGAILIAMEGIHLYRGARARATEAIARQKAATVQQTAALAKQKAATVGATAAINAETAALTKNTAAKAVNAKAGVGAAVGAAVGKKAGLGATAAVGTMDKTSIDNAIASTATSLRMFGRRQESLRSQLDILLAQRRDWEEMVIDATGKDAVTIRQNISALKKQESVLNKQIAVAGTKIAGLQEKQLGLQKASFAATTAKGQMLLGGGVGHMALTKGKGGQMLLGGEVGAMAINKGAGMAKLAPTASGAAAAATATTAITNFPWMTKLYGTVAGAATKATAATTAAAKKATSAVATAATSATAAVSAAAVGAVYGVASAGDSLQAVATGTEVSEWNVAGRAGAGLGDRIGSWWARNRALEAQEAALQARLEEQAKEQAKRERRLVEFRTKTSDQEREWLQKEEETVRKRSELAAGRLDSVARAESLGMQWQNATALMSSIEIAMKSVQTEMDQARLKHEQALKGDADKNKREATLAQYHAATARMNDLRQQRAANTASVAQLGGSLFDARFESVGRVTGVRERMGGYQGLLAELQHSPLIERQAEIEAKAIKAHQELGRKQRELNEALTAGDEERIAELRNEIHSAERNAESAKAAYYELQANLSDKRRVWERIDALQREQEQKHKDATDRLWSFNFQHANPATQQQMARQAFFKAQNQFEGARTDEERRQALQEMQSMYSRMDMDKIAEMPVWKGFLRTTAGAIESDSVEAQNLQNRVLNDFNRVLTDNTIKQTVAQEAMRAALEQMVKHTDPNNQPVLRGYVS